LDDERHSPPGKQWTDIIDKIKRAYWRKKELDMFRAQHAAAKKGMQATRQGGRRGCSSGRYLRPTFARPAREKGDEKQRKA
jgi:hypothetical protein